MDIFNHLKFISKKGHLFIPGSEAKLICDLTEWESDSVVKNGDGFFQGIISQPRIHYKLEEERCTYKEFNIFLKNDIVNNWTYSELLNAIHNKHSQYVYPVNKIF